VRAIASIIRPFYSRWDQAAVRGLLRDFEVPARQRFGSLSRGTRTKAALALALAHHAELLVLDEPTAGLDPVFRRLLLERLAAYVSDAAPRSSSPPTSRATSIAGPTTSRHP